MGSPFYFLSLPEPAGSSSRLCSRACGAWRRRNPLERPGEGPRWKRCGARAVSCRRRGARHTGLPEPGQGRSAVPGNHREETEEAVPGAGAGFPARSSSELWVTHRPGGPAAAQGHWDQGRPGAHVGLNPARPGRPVGRHLPPEELWGVGGRAPGGGTEERGQARPEFRDRTRSGRATLCSGQSVCARPPPALSLSRSAAVFHFVRTANRVWSPGHAPGEGKRLFLPCGRGPG